MILEQDLSSREYTKISQPMLLNRLRVLPKTLPLVFVGYHTAVDREAATQYVPTFKPPSNYKKADVIADWYATQTEKWYAEGAMETPHVGRISGLIVHIYETDYIWYFDDVSARGSLAEILEQLVRLPSDVSYSMAACNPCPENLPPTITLCGFNLSVALQLDAASFYRLKSYLPAWKSLASIRYIDPSSAVRDWPERLVQAAVESHGIDVLTGAPESPNELVVAAGEFSKVIALYSIMAHTKVI